MQTWHCIALIVLSIAVFLYASFVDEINNTAETSLTTLAEVSESSLEKRVQILIVIFLLPGQRLYWP